MRGGSLACAGKEVAHLAGVSTDYYAWLDRGKIVGVRPTSVSWESEATDVIRAGPEATAGSS